jgi:hypothetical protein
MVALASYSSKSPARAQAEIDTGIVECELSLNLFERRKRAEADHGRHVLEKLGIFRACGSSEVSGTDAFAGGALM